MAYSVVKNYGNTKVSCVSAQLSLGIDNQDQGEEEHKKWVPCEQVVVPHHTYHFQFTCRYEQTAHLEREREREGWRITFQLFSIPCYN